MKWLKNFVAKVSAYFASGRAEADFNVVAAYVPKALPIIEMVAQIVAAAVPATAPFAAALQMFAHKYPDLFRADADPDARKLAALGVATDLLKDRYPELSTSVARAAVQLAYVGQKADQKAA